MTAWATSSEAMVAKVRPVTLFGTSHSQRETGLELGLHRGWKEAVPKRLRKPLKTLRRRWYDWRWRLASE